MVGAIACGGSYAEAAATAGWPSRCACIAAVRQSPTRKAWPEAKAPSAVANFQVRRESEEVDRTTYAGGQTPICPERDQARGIPRG